MWLYDLATRMLVGDYTGGVPDGCGTTDIAPPTYRIGVSRRMGDDGKWYEFDIPSVSRAEGRLLLHRTGLLQQAEALIAQADIKSRIWYEDAQEWERGHPVVIAMGQALGLTPEQLDNLFINA